LAILLALVLVPVRDQLGNTNVALVMVLLVVAAASVGGRLSGAITAITASVSYNFFHTKPYLTLRVDSGREVVSIVLILVVGLAVGELGVARDRQSAVRRSHLRSIRALEEVGAKVSSGASAEEVWPLVKDAMVTTLSAQRTYFEPFGGLSALPVVERDGRIDEKHKRLVGDGFALPARGASVRVEAGGRTLGQLIVKPDANVGVTREQRRAAVAIADQFAIALLGESEIRALR
jgi:K+-sensing histidine kinase KdpD